MKGKIEVIDGVVFVGKIFKFLVNVFVFKVDVKGNGIIDIDGLLYF